MRIALVNTLYAPFGVGGAARSVRELADELADLGHEVLVVALAPSTWVGDEVSGQVRVERIVSDSSFEPFDSERPPLAGARKAIWHARENAHPLIARRLRQVLDSFIPDVVHTNNVAGFGLAAWIAARRYPIVHTMRDYYLLCARSQLYRNGALCQDICNSCALLKLPSRHSNRRPDLFVGVSQAVIDLHQSHGAIHAGERTAVVHNWPHAKRSARAKDDGVHIFGLLGRIGQDKGTWVALDAFRRLRDEYGNSTRLHIAGKASDSDLARITEYCSLTPGALYLGQNVDAAQFYRGIDTMLVPSQWFEPFGRVAAEALQSGCGVIASQVGGLPEAVNLFGGGLLIEDFMHATAWADAMATPPSPPAEVNVDRTSVAARYLALYRSLTDAE